LQSRRTARFVERLEALYALVKDTDFDDWIKLAISDADPPDDFEVIDHTHMHLREDHRDAVRAEAIENTFSVPALGMDPLWAWRDLVKSRGGVVTVLEPDLSLQNHLTRFVLGRHD
jgi:hypothetical protein